MREIKFRAWDKKRKEMFLSPGETEHLGSWFDSHLPGAIADAKNIDIMQSTGLHDKNGVEIYEGDILKRTSTIKQWERELFDEVIGEVTAEIGMTYLVGKCKHGYLDEELKTSNYKALLLSPDLFEVIGDTHNNPKLLESEGK